MCLHGTNLFGTFGSETPAFPGRSSRGRADPNGCERWLGRWRRWRGTAPRGTDGRRSDGSLAGDSDADNAGGITGDEFFSRNIDRFLPDRGYMPFSNIHGGAGGGGGSPDDDGPGTEVEDGGPPNNNDDGGGGGGSGGGGLCVICNGTLTVGATAVITANGGAGGNTYAVADHLLSDPDPDTDDDEFVSGVNPVALAGPGTGDGGPGGGGRRRQHLADRAHPA